MIQKSAIIIQARMSSRRFPKKMMAPLYGIPLLHFVYKRCLRSVVKNVVVATSTDASDDILAHYCQNNKIPVVRGSLENVLSRYIKAAELLGVNKIIRVCGDTPFVDIDLMGLFLRKLEKENLEYIAPNRSTCLAGFFFEVLTLDALKKVFRLTHKPEDLEHVTKYILDFPEKFSVVRENVELHPKLLTSKYTIDFPEDLEKAEKVLKTLSSQENFSSKEILQLIDNKVLVCVE